MRAPMPGITSPSVAMRQFDAAGRGGAGAGLLGAAPVGAGLAGQGSGTERDHAAWLVEDDDLWGTDSTAPPGVLG